MFVFRIAFWLCPLLLLPSVPTLGIAQDTAEQIEAPDEVTGIDPDEASRMHDELRALRDRMYAAYENRDVDALLSDCSDEIVITWQNGDRNVGHDAFRDFYKEMMSGENAIVKDISTTFEVDAESILYGDDTAIARGSVRDRFELSSGSDLVLSSKWTATVVKQQGDWKVASFHVSASIFDNAVLDKVKNSLFLVGAACGAIGLVLGWLLSSVLRRRSAA